MSTKMNEYLVVACSTALIPKQLAPGSGCAVFRTSPPFHLRVAELQHFKMAENVCSLWVPFVDVRCYPIRYLPPFLNLEWIARKQR